MEKKARKLYLDVIVGFDRDGNMYPKLLLWPDGREYIIDGVSEIVQRPALKAGGQGDRYTVRIRGKQRYLFFERSADLTGPNLGKWFVECPTL